MMNNDWKAKWITALTDGSHTQACGVLGGAGSPPLDAHCCLGVLLDISGLGEWSGCTYQWSGDDGLHEAVEDGDLSLRALSVFGLDGEQQGVLINMNDGVNQPDKPKVRKHTFAEIATYIEENL